MKEKIAEILNFLEKGYNCNDPYGSAASAVRYKFRGEYAHEDLAEIIKELVENKNEL